MCLLYDGNSLRLDRKWFYGEAGIRTCDPWFTRHSAYPLHHGIHLFFCGFSLGSNQYWAGRVYDLCVYYMAGTPEGSTESGFMEKPGIEPATPGLQDIALIHYTTGYSPLFCGFPWVETSTAGRVYDLCVYYMTGAPEGSPKVVLCVFFMVLWRSRESNLRASWNTRPWLRQQ